MLQSGGWHLKDELGTALRSEPTRWFEAAEQCTCNLLRRPDPKPPVLGGSIGCDQRVGLSLLGLRIPAP